MRIAIACNNKKNTAYQLGTSTGFMIFDVVNGKIRNWFYSPLYIPLYWQPSKKNRKSIDIRQAILRALNGCNTIISFGIESNLFKKLYKAGIEVFQTNETYVRSAVELYVESKK